jgi:hypothetical protein
MQNVSVQEKLKDIWKTIATDPDVIAGTIQILTALVGLLVAAIGRKKAPSI